MDLVERNASEGLRLIADLLGMERMAAGRLALQIEPHDFNEITQYTFKTFEHQGSNKMLSLHGNCPDANATVFCDRGRISQVLTNLTSNALKFTPSGGQVGLSVDCG